MNDNFSISLWFKNSNNDFPLVNWSGPNFSLGVRSQTPRLTQNQNLDCSSSIESGYWNHLVVTINDAQQKIYLNGNDCGTKNEMALLIITIHLSELDGTAAPVIQMVLSMN